MEPRLPQPDYEVDLEWQWPWDVFGLDPEILFTTLHSRFNTITIPLQSPRSFYLDVGDCIDQSNTEEEFYSKLEERKAQRKEELTSAWNDISSLLHKPELHACSQCWDRETFDKEKRDLAKDSPKTRWHAFRNFSQAQSFESMVRYFDVLVRDERKRREERREEERREEERREEERREEERREEERREEERREEEQFLKRMAERKEQFLRMMAEKKESEQRSDSGGAPQQAEPEPEPEPKPKPKPQIREPFEDPDWVTDPDGTKYYIGSQHYGFTGSYIIYPDGTELDANASERDGGDDDNTERNSGSHDNHPRQAEPEPKPKPKPKPQTREPFEDQDWMTGPDGTYYYIGSQHYGFTGPGIIYPDGTELYANVSKRDGGDDDNTERNPGSPGSHVSCGVAEAAAAAAASTATPTLTDESLQQQSTGRKGKVDGEDDATTHAAAPKKKKQRLANGDGGEDDDTERNPLSGAGEHVSCGAADEAIVAVAAAAMAAVEAVEAASTAAATSTAAPDAPPRLASPPPLKRKRVEEDDDATRPDSDGPSEHKKLRQMDGGSGDSHDSVSMEAEAERAATGKVAGRSSSPVAPLGGDEDAGSTVHTTAAAQAEQGPARKRRGRPRGSRQGGPKGSKGSKGGKTQPSDEQPTTSRQQQSAGTKRSRRERKGSPLAQETPEPRRSRRGNAAAELWYLGDKATATRSTGHVASTR